MIFKIIYGLIILGIIVFIHEMGHLVASLICGVKVEAFSIGMGPVLIHKTIKKIDWRISLLPLGGYCAMKGEKDLTDALENGDDNFYSDSDSLYGVSPLKRAFIAFAGPLSNLLLTYISLVIIAMIGYTYWSSGNQITIATETYPELHSAAADAGIKSGDKIIQINREKIDDFYQLYSFVSLHPDENLEIKVLRGEEKLTFTVHSDLDTSTGAGKIGVMSDPSSAVSREAPTYGFFEALVQGAVETLDMISATFTGIASLFKGVKVTEAVSGPAAITTMLGDTVSSAFSFNIRNGISSILNFVALISISLFIMNLLPVPVLDGGLVLLSIIEFVFKTHISPKVRYRVQYIGLAFIGFLLVTAMISDFNFIMRLFNE